MASYVSLVLGVIIGTGLIMLIPMLIIANTTSFDKRYKLLWWCSGCKRPRLKISRYFFPIKEKIRRHYPGLAKHIYLCRQCILKKKVVDRLEGRKGKYCPYCNLDYNTNIEWMEGLNLKVTNECLGCGKKLDKRLK